MQDFIFLVEYTVHFLAFAQLSQIIYREEKYRYDFRIQFQHQ